MRHTYIAIIAASILAGIGVGVLASRFMRAESEALQTMPLSGDFPLINPAVTAGLNKHFIINFKPLRESFEAITKKYPEGKTYVYFGYLNNAAWTGLNERDVFVAASTIKVPLAMSLLKAVEAGKVNLEDRYVVEEDDVDKDFGTFYQSAIGNEFSLRELTEVMLKQFDNTAMRTIIRIMRSSGIEDPLSDVYSFMGWDFADFGEAPRYEEINLKTLSNMFLALYNAQYVNPEHSELILGYLAESPFMHQIVAGVPKGTLVAHKIGVNEDKRTLSDCGIVFVPNRNYILCLGAENLSDQMAANFMKDASLAAYEYVTTH